MRKSATSPRMFLLGVVGSVLVSSANAFLLLGPHPRATPTGRTTPPSFSLYSSASPVATSVGPRIPINEDYPGLEKIHSYPDIFVIHDFLESSACQDMIAQATTRKTLQRSPVAYAGDGVVATQGQSASRSSIGGPRTSLAKLRSVFCADDGGHCGLYLVAGRESQGVANERVHDVG